MLKRYSLPASATTQNPQCVRSRLRSRSRLLAALILSSTWLGALPVFAASPTPGTVIDNQATGSFIDSTDNSEKAIASNTVSVTVGEVAGITVTAANTPSAAPGGTANFEFRVTNVGNDPTQFFIPGAPSASTGGTAETLKIIAYDPDGTGPLPAVDLTASNLTVPPGGATTGTVLGAIAAANNGVMPVGGAIVVQVPVTVTATNGNPVSVTLGNTSGQPSNSNTPYVVGANGTGGQDVYTVDNADGVAGEAAGIPLNGDAATHRQEASATTTVTAVAVNVTVSGTVFSDANGDVTINGSDAGTNAGSANLTVYAVDPAGNVVDKATVAANGLYSLATVPANSTVILRLSNDSAVAIGAPAPTAASIPSGWVNTGENKNGVTETTTLGDIAVTVASVNISNQNFGIEQLPNTTDLTATSQPNPGGTTTIQVPTLAGTDPEDGALGSGKTFKIVTLPTNGTLTYNGSAVTVGQTIPNYNPALLLLDPNDGAITVSFTYAAVDAAGQVDPTPATVSIPFTDALVAITGIVFDDANGSKLQNGTEVGSNGGGLNAVLVDSTNQVVASAVVAANGTYTFSNVSPNATYTVQITTNPATVGAAPPAIALPSNWVSTGENLNSTIDGTVDSKLSVTVTTNNVIGVNFGMEQRPDTTAVTGTTQTNPGGTTAVQVATLAGTDPEDGTLGSTHTFQIVTLPTNATLTYNNLAVTAGQVISNYDPTLLKVDPTDVGPTTVSFTYAAVDAAGQVDPTPATVTIPFTGAPKLLLVKRITAINGGTAGRDLNGTPIDFTQFVNDPNTTDDNHANWVGGYLTGAIDGGIIKNNDEVEYTIYFLSSGTSVAKNVRLCDRVPDQTTFVPTGFNSGSFAADPAGLPGADRGIVFSLGGNGVSLSNVADGDRAQFIPAGVDPTTVYPGINCGGANTNGAVVVNLGDVINATGQGAPAASYGFIRFRAQAK